MANYWIGMMHGADCGMYALIGYGAGTGYLSLYTAIGIAFGVAVVGEGCIRLLEKSMGVIYP